MAGSGEGSPRGTATFLLTDVEGSTRLWEDATEAMQVALAWHDAAIRDAIAAHGGRLLKTRGEGDSTFSVFSRASAAVAAALEIQRRLLVSEQEVGLSLRVRVGIHTGEAELRDDDYFGPAVNRCARLRATAHGGQVVLSEAAAEISSAALPAGATLDDLGIHRLKDLARPEHVFQLSHPDLPRAFPPLASLDSRTHNLPVQLTRFVGRERELGAVTEAVAKNRLVTITGIGGVGKTRVALHVAAETIDRHRHGSWLVELDSVESERVPAAVSEVLRVREEPGRAITDTLKDHVLGRDVLVVMDNCEHVIDAAARLASELLEASPGLRMLATSREALGVPGEVVVNLAPMTVPHDDNIAALRASDAASLFIDRAQLAKPEFIVRPGEEPALGRICRDLDGIALAIELAAARVRMMTLPQIAELLGDRFRLLTGGSRTASHRQQTLRATIDWSYQLLSREEQRVFRALAVFPGGTTLLDATAVAGADVFEVIVQLVDKSVVVAADDDRFTMLNTVRAYALDRLRERGEEADVRQRQLAWATELIDSSDHDRVASEHDNLLDLLRWAEASAPAGALELAVHLHRFWENRGHWSIGRDWLIRLARHPDIAPVSHATALAKAADLVILQGDFASARALLGESRQVGEEVQEVWFDTTMSLGRVAASQGDFSTARQIFDEAVAGATTASYRARALANVGSVSFSTGEFERAAAHFDEAIAAAQTAGDESLLATVLSHRGMLAGARGNEEHARRDLMDALGLARKLGNAPQIATALSYLGRLELRRGKLDDARSLVEEALGTQRRLTEQAGVAHSLVTLAEIARLQDDHAAARRLAEESLTVAGDIGFPLLAANAELELAYVDAAAGERASALTRYRQALDIFSELESISGIAAGLEGVAALAAAAGQHELAGELLGAADSRRGITAAAEPRDADRTRTEAQVRGALGDRPFDAAVSAGHALSVDAAVAKVRSMAL